MKNTTFKSILTATVLSWSTLTVAQVGSQSKNEPLPSMTDKNSQATSIAGKDHLAIKPATSKQYEVGKKGIQLETTSGEGSKIIQNLRMKNGGIDTGGGYKYRDTTAKHLATAQRLLIGALEALNQSDLDAITSQYTINQFDKKKLSEYISEVQIDEDPKKPQVVNGKSRALDMTYSLANGGSVTALKPFLEFFHKATLTQQEEYLLKRKVIHEISHLFGVGTNDDEVSYRLSTALTDALIQATTFCGGIGSIEERISNCAEYLEPFKEMNSTFPDRVQKHGPLVMSSVKNKKSSRIEDYSFDVVDARSKIGYLLIELGKANLVLFPNLAHPELRTAEDICAQMNSFDDQVVWAAANENQIEQLYVKSNGWSPIALANGKISYSKNGNTIVTDFSKLSRDQQLSQFKVVCLGAVK